MLFTLLEYKKRSWSNNIETGSLPVYSKHSIAAHSSYRLCWFSWVTVSSLIILCYGYIWS